MKFANVKEDKVKSLAAYYTNTRVAKLISNLAIYSPSAKVADFSCGEGNLLISANFRKEELANLDKDQALSADCCLPWDFIGIDIDLQAAKKAHSHLTNLTKSYRAFISATNSTTLKPGDVVQGIAGDKLALEKVDTVMMNPPFIRHESFSEKQKLVLRKTFDEYSSYFNGRSGLYAYFLFLADRFALDGGRVAMVVPATALRIQSALGLRKFLLDNYTIEHIIMGYETAAFSQLAQFREVIVISVKAKPKIDSRCTVSFLRRLPHSEAQANLFSTKLTEFLSKMEDRYTDGYLSAQKVSQVELSRNIGNLYCFLCGLDSGLPSLSEETRRMGFGKLVTIDCLVKSKRWNITRFDFPPSNRGAFVIRQSRVSLKVKRNANEWVIGKEENSQVTIRNQLSNQTLKVRRNCFTSGLRRACRVSTIDISGETDLVIIKSFKGVDAVTDETYIPKLRKSINQRTSNLLIQRRFDVSSPGTRLLAFYSNDPIVGVDMWGIKRLSEQEAKSAAIWFNSSFYLMELLLNRTETTGAWLRLDACTLRTLPIIEFEKLSDTERSRLIQLFDSLKSVNFTSIFNQLKIHSTERRKIDTAVAEIIGYSKEEIDRFLERLYPALVQEIEKLRQLMFQGMNRKHAKQYT